MKNTIDQANPFIGISQITYSESDILELQPKVISNTSNGVVVSLDDDHSGFISIEKLGESKFIGNKISILVDGDKNFRLQENKDKQYISFLEKAKTGQLLYAHITGSTDNGLLGTIDNENVFMPLSQISNPIPTDLSYYVGKDISCRLKKIKLKENEGNRFLPIVSHRVVEEEKDMHNAIVLVEDLKIGSILEGSVKSIVSYGAFVNICPELDGLIHLKELSWNRISDASEILSVGQKIKVVVIDIQRTPSQKIKLSLGYKQLQEKPWDKLDPTLQMGDVVSGKICAIQDYGVFLQLPCGVEGMIHKTELDWDGILIPSDFQKGDVLSAKILNLDKENQKLLLSLKQTKTDPWSTIESTYPIGKRIRGTIYNIRKNALFLIINDGAHNIGYVPIAEIVRPEGQKLKHLFSDGDTIDAYVIGINKDKRYIELSTKFEDH